MSDDDVPIFNFNKTKLKSFSFATSVSSLLFQNFSKETSKTSVCSSQFTDSNIFDQIKLQQQATDIAKAEDERQSSKRTRDEEVTQVPQEEDTNQQLNKKSKTIDFDLPEEPHEMKRKKTSFNSDNNYRKLNMKSFKFKGKGGGKFNLKGAKYKQWKWKNNKMNSQYSNNNQDDDDDNCNQNLLKSNYTKQKKKKKDDDIEVEDSIEAIFAKTNNNNLQAEITSEKSEPTTSKLLKSPKKSNKKINETKKSKETKKDTEHNKENDETVAKKPRAKRTTTKTTTEKVGDDDEESEEKTVTKPKKQQTRSKKIAVEDNEDAVIDDKDSESDEETKAKTKKQPKTPKAKKTAKVDESESEHEIVSETEVIQPVFPLDSNGETLPSLPDYVYKVLEKDFGHKSFKAHQGDAVLRICSGLSALVVLSTGYGKSLIYQMAARLYAKKYPGSVCLVISPLISLMQDQLHNLSKCLKAAVCDSTMNEKDYSLMLQDLNNGKINILFMSPEAIMNKKIRKIPRLAFVCIDEVHCLSQWSHNFRPSYLQICQSLSDHYNVKCILGLTATATQQTIAEIGSFFKIEKQSILLDCDLPSNLSLSVSKDLNKERALVELFRSNQFEPFFNHVIIYCSRREQTEKISQLLRLTFQSSKKLYSDLSEIEKRPKGITKKSKSAKITDNDEKSVAEAYHAGLTTSQRKRIQNDFIKGKLRVIVATMAFGMGINMSNIRAVIHYNMPKSIENYVQEIGRAGRDGKLSRCHLFLETQQEDINEIKKYIHMNGYDHKTIKKLILKIFDCCSKENCKYIKNQNETEFNHQVALPIDELVDLLDIKEETILTLLCYLQSAKKIKLFQNCYKYCKIRSYKGYSHLNDLAKSNDLVAKLLKQKTATDLSDFDIDIMQLCNDLDGDYDTIRLGLRRLEWQIDEYGTYKAKSGISIEFQSKSFYLKRKCITDDTELDDVNDHLWNRVSSQMHFSHTNFKALYKILSENSFNSVGEYVDGYPTDNTPDQVEPKSNVLKQHFNDYFNNKLNIDEFTKCTQLEYEQSQSSEKEKPLIANIKRFIYTYEKEIKLSGTVIARIFHGISTPRYPAEVWGRNRNFWRAHLDIEFERLTKLCTQQLLNC